MFPSSAVGRLPQEDAGDLEKSVERRFEISENKTIFPFRRPDAPFARRPTYHEGKAVGTIAAPAQPPASLRPDTFFGR